MSANTDVVPPTSASVPRGAAAWASGRSRFWTRLTAAVDSGSWVRYTVNSAVAPSLLVTGAATEPTPGIPLSFAWYEVTSAAVSVPDDACRYTWVGSVSQGGEQRDGDRDGQGRAERPEDAQGRQGQRQERRDDHAGRRGDYLSDAGDRLDHRLLLVVAQAQPLPVAEHQEQEVVRPDPEQHHEQDGAVLAGGVQVQGLVEVGDEAQRDLVRDADQDERHDRDDRGPEDDQQQHQDEQERRRPDDGQGLVARLGAVERLGGRAGDALVQPGPGHERLDGGPQCLDRVAGRGAAPVDDAVVHRHEGGLHQLIGRHRPGRDGEDVPDVPRVQPGRDPRHGLRVGGGQRSAARPGGQEEG